LAKVLIIDDSPEFRVLMGKIMERAEHEILTAQDGDEGLQVARAQQPDLILLDYMMPGMNGNEVFHELRDNDNTCMIPVIMITAFSTNYESDRTAALRAGMEDYLTKPISPKDLIERVNNLLYLRRNAPRPSTANPFA